MFNLELINASAEAERLVVFEEKIIKHRVKVNIIKREKSSLLISGNKKELFKSMNWLQREKVFVDVKIFIFDFGKLIEFSAEEVRRGWREIFRNETEFVEFSENSISFFFETQIKKVIKPLGLERSFSRDLIADEKGKIVAECVPRRKSCGVSFKFSLKTAGYIERIVQLPALTEIKKI